MILARAVDPAQKPRVGHRGTVFAEVLAGVPGQAELGGQESVVCGIAYSGCILLIGRAGLAGGAIVGEVPPQQTLPRAPILSQDGPPIHVASVGRREVSATGGAAVWIQGAGWVRLRQGARGPAAVSIVIEAIQSRRAGGLRTGQADSGLVWKHVLQEEVAASATAAAGAAFPNHSAWEEGAKLCQALGAHPIQTADIAALGVGTGDPGHDLIVKLWVFTGQVCVGV